MYKIEIKNHFCKTFKLTRIVKKTLFKLCVKKFSYKCTTLVITMSIQIIGMTSIKFFEDLFNIKYYVLSILKIPM